MKHELWYSVVVRDRQGKVVSRERRRARSMLKLWNQYIYVMMVFTPGGGSLVVTDIDGNSWGLGPGTGGKPFTMKSGAGVTNYGIVVGTGNTAVQIDDYALKTLIAEGAGAGQMNYLPCTVADATVSDPFCSFVVSRSIANNSGGSITVRETGIYTILERGVSPFLTGYGCIVREVLGTPQEVPNGGAMTVDYTVRVTV
ncbi:hypothetical protein KKF82_04240 [Patescibacteria group bacterium]|nr:hypothetical protein [Patescibacteria group bacterium]